MAGGGKNLYLLTYNLLSFVGWLGILVRVVEPAFTIGFTYAYRATRDRVELMQLAALLEIAHAALGVTRGNVASAAMQNFGRNVVLFFVLRALPDEYAAAAKDTAWVGVLFAVWAASEVCRFPYYAGAIMAGGSDKVPAWLAWLRYSAFVPLYPLGFAAEVMVLYEALPAIAAADLHGGLFHLVPGLGALVGFRGLLLCYMAYAYGVGAPKLYLYMLKQRRKQLAGAKKKGE